MFFGFFFFFFWFFFCFVFFVLFVFCCFFFFFFFFFVFCCFFKIPVRILNILFYSIHPRPKPVKKGAHSEKSAEVNK